MSSLTFNQQLFLMLIDKLAIGAILAAIFFWAQKRLDAFKAQQSLESEVAKARVESIANGWKALNAWDLAVGDLIWEFAKFIREQDPALGKDAGLDELGEPDLIQIADWLASLQGHSTLERVKEYCETGLEGLLKQSVEQSGNTRKIMQENRFWFGKDLYEHCKQFHAILHGICMSFGNRDFERLTSQLRTLDKARQDVLTTLQDLRSLSASPSRTR